MKKILILVIIAVSFISSNVFATIPISDEEREAFKESQEVMCHDVIITFLAPTIKKAIDDYYKNTLKYLPIFATYMTNVQKVSRPNEERTGYYIIEIEVMPYVGPYLTVGKDLITIEIIYPGETKILNFEHLEDHRLPEQYNDLYLGAPGVPFEISI